ncbi:MAG TPA: hypothetical protein EYP65_01335, partial [Armatimonadetes bacterium]|nr:hypothetical protein [Armatimonadota bacterium]
MEFFQPTRAGNSGSEVVYFTTRDRRLVSVSFILWGKRFDERLSLGLNPYVGEITWMPWNSTEGRPWYERRKTRFKNWFPFYDFDGTLVDYSPAKAPRWLAIRYRTRPSPSDPWGPWKWVIDFTPWAPVADPASGTVTLNIPSPLDSIPTDPQDYGKTWEFQAFVRYACKRWKEYQGFETFETSPVLTTSGLIFGLSGGTGVFLVDEGPRVKKLTDFPVGWILPSQATAGSYANGVIFAAGGTGGVGAISANERGAEFPLGTLLWNWADPQVVTVNHPPTATARAIYVTLKKKKRREEKWYLMAFDPDPRDFEKGAFDPGKGEYDYKPMGWKGGDEPAGDLQSPPLDDGDPYFDNFGQPWEFPLGSAPSAPPVAANGAVLMATQGGKVIALSMADTLIVDGVRLLLVDAQGRAVWECSSSIDPVTKKVSPFRHPAMAVTLSSLGQPTQYLVADTGNDRVVVVDRGAREVWELSNKYDRTARRWYAFNDDPVPDWGKNAPLLRPGQPRTVRRPTFAYRYASTSPTGNYQVRTVVADAGNRRVIEVVDEYDQNGKPVQVKQLAYVSNWEDIPALKGAEVRSV